MGATLVREGDATAGRSPRKDSGRHSMDCPTWHGCCYTQRRGRSTPDPLLLERLYAGRMHPAATPHTRKHLDYLCSIQIQGNFKSHAEMNGASLLIAGENNECIVPHPTLLKEGRHIGNRLINDADHPQALFSWSIPALRPQQQRQVRQQSTKQHHSSSSSSGGGTDIE